MIPVLDIDDGGHGVDDDPQPLLAFTQRFFSALLLGDVKVDAVPDNFTVLPAMGDRYGLNPKDRFVRQKNRIFKNARCHLVGRLPDCLVTNLAVLRKGKITDDLW